MMKNFNLITLLLLFFSIAANAQNVPYGMKYQAVARDLSGAVLGEQNIHLKITLYSEQDRQTQYCETHLTTTNPLGLFSLTIGEGQVQKGNFANVPWSTHNIWMELAIDESGGSNFTTISDSKLLAVPYAFHAATAGQLSSSGSGSEKALDDELIWLIGGNEITTLEPPGSTIFTLGTLDRHDLILITNNTTAMTIASEDGKVDIVGDLEIGNNLNVNNQAILGSLEVQGPVALNTFGGATTIHEPTEIKKTLSVGDATTLHYSLDVLNGAPSNLTGRLNVDGATSLQSSLDVYNGSPTNLTGLLNVDGTTDLNSALRVNNSSPSLLTGSLTVNGLTTLTNTTQSTSTSNGALQVRGGVGIGKNLNVGGDAKFKGTFSVVNAASAGNEFGGHVAHFENTLNGQGVRIKVGASTPHNNNNFITFLNSSGSVVGRIEGENGSDDFAANQEYQDDLDFFDVDIGLGVADVALAASEVVMATADLAGASGSTTVCGGLGGCVTSPVPSLISVAGANLVITIANAVVATTNLILVEDAKSTYVATHEALQGITFASGAEDYAEYLPKKNPANQFYPGEVVGLKNGFISKNTLEADRIMVISFKPAVLGGLPQEGEEDQYEKVAFLGQIPTRVVGTVAAGDYILPSGFHNGHAIAKHPDKMLLSDYKKILGVAWDSSNDPGVNLINVAVGLNVNDLSGVVQQQAAELEALKKQIGQTNHLLAELVPGFKEAVGQHNPVIMTADHDTHESDALPSEEHDHDFLTQHDVEMITPDETNIVYYVPERAEYLEWIEMARQIYLDNGGKIETHPFWNRLASDPDYVEEVIQELESKFDKAIHYHVEANKIERE